MDDETLFSQRTLVSGCVISFSVFGFPLIYFFIIIIIIIIIILFIYFLLGCGRVELSSAGFMSG